MKGMSILTVSILRTVIVFLLTAWMFISAYEIYMQAGNIIQSGLSASIGLTMILTSMYLSSRKQRLNEYEGYAILSLVSIPSFIAVFAIRETAGLETYPLTVYGLLTIVVFLFIAIEMMWVSRKSK